MADNELTWVLRVDTRTGVAALDGLDKAIGKVNKTLGSQIKEAKSLKDAWSPVHSMILKIAGAVGMGMLIKSFVSAASATEQLRLKLRAMTGSEADSLRFYQSLRDFSDQTTISMKELASTVPTLFGVMGRDMQQVINWLPMIADMAKYFAVPFETAAQQIQRMYLNGASSAREFEMAGINAMLGFKKGTKYSIEETRQMLINAWNDPTKAIKGFAEKSKDTWAGAVSGFVNQWESFRDSIMGVGDPNGVFATMTKYLKDLNVEIGKMAASGKLQEWSKSISKALIFVLDNFKKFVDWVMNNQWVVPTALALIGGYKTLTALGNVVTAINSLKFAFAGLYAKVASSRLGIILADMAKLSLNPWAALGTTIVFAAAALHDFMKYANQLQKDINAEEAATKLNQSMTDKIRQIRETGSPEQVRALNEALSKQHAVRSAAGGKTSSVVAGAPGVGTDFGTGEEEDKEKGRSARQIKAEASLLASPYSRKARLEKDLADTEAHFAEMESEFEKQYKTEVSFEMEKVEAFKAIHAKYRKEDLELQKEWDEKWLDENIEVQKTREEEAKKAVAAIYQEESDNLHALAGLSEYERELNKKKADDRKQLAFNSLQFAEDSLSKMSDLYGQWAESGVVSKSKAFKMQKAFSIAETVINTATAVMKAMAELPFPLNIAQSAVVGAMGATQVAMISSQRAAYGRGGVSWGPEMALVGERGPEAHIPLAGGAVPVRFSGGNTSNRSFNVIMNNPTFQDIDTQKAVFSQIASTIAEQVAPGAVVKDYMNDGSVRSVVRGGG